MLFIFIVAVLLSALRLWGETSELYKTIAHLYIGGLSGYSVGVQHWVVILSVVVLIFVEVYAFLSKIFPAIAISVLLGKLNPKK